MNVMSQTNLTGQITNESGEPIADASVFLSELNLTARTNIDGQYTVADLPFGEYTLLVLSDDYEVKTFTINCTKALIEKNIALSLLSQDIDAVVVYSQEELRSRIRLLEDVEGTEVYAGKKTEVVQVENLVANKTTNKARQIYAQVVGLNIYEDCSGGLQLNIGGRGLNPNRSANFNTRQNGYDISADVLGYPESYYTPTAEAIREVQVIRGAASLQYGSQFGGLVNFKLIEPQSGKINGKVRLSKASYNTNAVYGQLDGKTKKVDYLVYGNYKNGNCYRPNSDYNSLNTFGKVKYKFSNNTSFNVEFTHMNSLAKQPGGLTDAQFYKNDQFSNRERNWFEVNWNLLAARLEHQMNENSKLSWSLNGLSASRNSLGFRTNRVSQVDSEDYYRDLIKGSFKNISSEFRYLTDYNIGNTKLTGLLGAKYYQSKNTAEQGVGAKGSDANFNILNNVIEENTVRPSDFTFPNQNLAIFSEQIIRLKPNLTVTPGLRFETIKTESKGDYSRYDFDLAGNIINNATFEDNRVFNRNFFLYGAGVSYKPTNWTELYSNYSKNYRSVTFSDIRIINPSFQIDPNIQDESGYTVDLGYRGRKNNQIHFDFSVFGLNYNNRLGEILQAEKRINADGSVSETGKVIRYRGNIGRAFIYGFESFAEWNLGNTIEKIPDDVYSSIFINTALTKSKYLESKKNGVEGKEVEFIPLLNFKGGYRFGYKNLLGNFQVMHLSEQFTDATNAPQNQLDNQRGIEGEIPAYTVMDLSLSYKWRNLQLETGANNLMNTSYFTRRATGYPGPGIIPSDKRSYYITLQAKF